MDNRLPEARARRSCVINYSDKNAPKKRKKPEIDPGKCWEDFIAVRREKDENDWICSVCNLTESKDNTDLILCDGPCLRSFHIGCMNAKRVAGAIKSEGEWFCDDCPKARHACHVCGQKGKVDKVRIRRHLFSTIEKD